MKLYRGLSTVKYEPVKTGLVKFNIHGQRLYNLDLTATIDRQNNIKKDISAHITPLKSARMNKLENLKYAKKMSPRKCKRDTIAQRNKNIN
jgi:hypothetical protein